MACNQHQLGLCLSGFTSSSAHHQHQVIFIFSPKLTWAVRIISSFVPVRRQHASSASAGLCLYGGNFGDTHHQHQLGCACSQAVQAMRIISVSWFVLVGIISISWFVLVQRHPGQCTSSSSSASAGLCLPVLVRRQPLGSAHHQHQPVCTCPKPTRSERIISISWVVLVRRQPRHCASSASAGPC